MFLHLDSFPARPQRYTIPSNDHVVTVNDIDELNHNEEIIRTATAQLRLRTFATAYDVLKVSLRIHDIGHVADGVLRAPLKWRCMR